MEKDSLTRTLDLEQAASLLKINKCTAGDLAASGKLPGAKIGRAWVFLEQDLIDWLREQVREQQQQRLAGNDHARCTVTDVKTSSRRRPLPELPKLPSQI